MLVLSRKVGEKLVVGDQITIEVVRVKGNRVTLGVVAPKHVKVLRGELARKGSHVAGNTVDSTNSAPAVEMIVEDGVLDVA
ncbi:MAG TPA: carbon storage regulator [Planctomycetaceae bacterium]|nr:carbon storage regulator [Planctomycetaceae bacterium]